MHLHSPGAQEHLDKLATIATTTTRAGTYEVQLQDAVPQAWETGTWMVWRAGVSMKRGGATTVSTHGVHDCLLNWVNSE